MTDLYRLVALSDHYPEGTCWAWQRGAEKVCGRPDTTDNPHLCPQHVRMARRVLERETAKAAERREKAATAAAARRPLAVLELAEVDAQIARLDPPQDHDRAAANAPLRQRMPSDTRIATLARLHERRAQLVREVGTR